MKILKHYKAVYCAPTGDPGLAEYDATHFSVSNAGAVLFYREVQGDTKDELVGSIACNHGPIIISLDEKSAIVEGIIDDLSEDMEEAIKGAFGLDEVPEGQKLRITVTLL